MKDIFLTLLPFFISSLIGYLTIRSLNKNHQDRSLSLDCFLSIGLGLGLSAYLTFLSFLIYDQLNTFFVITLHLGILLGLLLINFINFQSTRISFPIQNSIKTFALVSLRALFAKQSFKKIASAKKRPRKDTEILYIFPWIQIILWILLLLSLIPLWIYSHSYPYGGWDAWQVWNLKAKFLFLGGENWKNIFHESLWRSSPHYPLLLPIINVWGWIFSKDATYSVPLFTALIFSIALVGLLSQAIYRSTRSFLSILPVLLIFTHPLLLNLTISQYADLPFAFYLFAGLFCLYQAKTKPLLTSYFLLLTSLFLSFLSFTKPEGLIAAIVVIFLSLPYLLWENNLRSLKKIFLIYLISLFIAFLPSIVFYGLYAPKNITFINGFLSTAKPSDLNRLKIIAMYYVLEIFSAKWNGLWILLLGGFILSIKKCFTRKILIFPAFLLIYSAIIILYYQTNTYFEIGWWLQSTLHRILFTLLPTIIFWIFTSLAEKQTLNSKP